MRTTSSSQTVASCGAPPTSGSSTAAGGGSRSANCSTDRRRRASDAPPDSSLEQLLYGCLLGDAAIVRSSPTASWRVVFRHGSKQEAYCRHKADRLARYVRTGPKVVPNAGWGDRSVIFATVSSPVFSPLAAVVAPHGRKAVTPEWAAALGWEAVAYWLMDDGTRQANAIHFCTHGFSPAEADLLACRLRTLGLASARVGRVRVNTKPRPVVRLSAEDSRELSLRVARWVHPTLAYKLVGARPAVRCCVCGAIFRGRKDQAAALRPVCGRRDCSLARQRALRAASLTPARRAAKNAAARLRYAARPASSE